MKFNRNNSGFTIVELAVVLAIFLFIVGAAISIFLSVLQNQKKILAQTQLLNQISYAQEYMSRALRMARAASSEWDIDCVGEEGFVYKLTRLEEGKYRGIKFLNQSNTDVLGNALCQEFFLDNEDPNDYSSPLVLKELKNNSEQGATNLTPPNLQIESMVFSINGSDGSPFGCSDVDQCGASKEDLVQPRVTILSKIKIPGDDQEPIRTIQTTVSQRNLNVK